jgi:hypothetical protein
MIRVMNLARRGGWTPAALHVRTDTPGQQAMMSFANHV